MTNAPTRTDSRKGVIRFLASISKRIRPGLSTAKYRTNVDTTATGKKPSVVNFETTAKPVVAPSNKLCCKPGCSAQTSSEKKAAIKQPVRAISVVATPACAKTGGNIVNSAVAVEA